MTVNEAETLILQHAQRFAERNAPLAECVGHVLREDIIADRDWPPFDRSMMDGIAIATGARSFTIEGIQPAGKPASSLRDRRNGCIQIMTGAVMPEGANAVVPIEDYEIQGDCVVVRLHVEVKPGQFIHYQGSDRKTGDELLTSGTRLLPPHIALLASCGRREARIAEPPNVAVASIGDELIEAGQPLETFQIRPSNADGVAAGLRQLGASRVELSLLRDDEPLLREALAGMLRRNRLIILSGGVSKGAYDFVPGVLAKLGVKKILHRVAQKPGQPMWYGIHPDGIAVFALPGNPVASLVCFRRYVVPWWWRSAGTLPPPAPFVALARGVSLDRPLTHFLPVRLEEDATAGAVASLLAYHGSGDHASLAHSQGFVELPPEGSPYPAGARVRYHAWQS